MEIDAFYFKTLILTKVSYEDLTDEQQVEFIRELIKDHNMYHPQNKINLMTTNFEDDGSLDW